jgi:GntR family transcriptional regulator/MocR family aminotransferase
MSRPVLLDAIRLDRAAPAALGRQIHAAIRTMVLDGTLPPGARLPSSRALAEGWGLARNTVVAAFEQLVAEGFLNPARGAGVFVADVVGARLAPRVAPRLVATRRGAAASAGLSARGRAAAEEAQALAPSPPGPLAPDIPALDRFPLDLWHRSVLRSARRYRTQLLRANDPRGFAPLRAAIAAHIGPARGVLCAPEQVVVLTSSRMAIAIAATMLTDRGDRAAIEEPGYLGARALLAAQDLDLVPMPVDREGADIAALEGSRARLIYLTPSHQYPLGYPMSLKRRMAALEAAQRLGAWIIEDDYDGEFQFRGHPVPSLHGLSGGTRVVYLGTFSKATFTAIRLSYLVVPPDLVDAFAAVRVRIDGATTLHSQAALADFMESGAFATHVRRMRGLYGEREAALLHHAARLLRGAIDLPAPGGGLQLAARFVRPVRDVALVQALDPAVASPAPLSRFYLGRPQSGLVMSFGAWDETTLERAVAHIARTLAGQTSARQSGPARKLRTGSSA